MTSAAPTRADGFRIDLQALRALAVSLVVLFHAWPRGRLPGGYVGVDVFFVISGFLITAHLARELDSTGRIRFAAFYARRARRLLPASLATLAVVLPVSLVLLPLAMWSAVAKEVMASAFYVENLWLARKAVTYSASNDLASPVQHFWSLSAEEQFYLVWPALIVLAALVGQRVLRARRELAIVIALGAVVAVSLAFSITHTRTHPAAAYFVTPTRAWEFGLGALAVFASRRWLPSTPMAVGLRYAGLLAIMVAALTFSDRTPFPGWIALWPVLGAAAVILAGPAVGPRADPLHRLWASRPVQRLGDMSYSLYLWHWPVIVWAPYALRRYLTPLDRVSVVLLTIALAWCSWRFVEPLAQRSPLLARHTLRALTATVVAMALVAAAGVTALAWTGHRQSAVVVDVESRIASATTSGKASEPGGTIDCFGAAALRTAQQCPTALTDPPYPLTEAETPWSSIEGCAGGERSDLGEIVCTWGGTPTAHVVGIGDSHLEHWQRPLQQIARDRGWHLRMFLWGGCPAADVDILAFEGRPHDPTECRGWVRRITDLLRDQPLDLVVTSQYAAASTYSTRDAAADGFTRAWQRWTPQAPVAVIRDIPDTHGGRPAECLAIRRDPLACAMERTAALGTDPATQAARADTTGRVHLLDLTDRFCDATRCFVVVGGVPVYYDRDHLTATYARSLAPDLDRALAGVLAAPTRASAAGTP